MDFSSFNFALIFFIIFISYMIGSLNFSIIISKYFLNEQDIRNLGSNNAGFSNMLRSIGILPALFTFVGDFLKGIVAVYIAKILKFKCGFDDNSEMVFILVVSFFCCVGHMWPCFFGFKGGKGILTAWSCSLLLDWRIFVFLISVFLVVLFISKIISLSSIVAAVFYPVLVFIFSKNIHIVERYISFCLAILLSLIVIFKHRSNIKRILRGQENKLEFKKR